MRRREFISVLAGAVGACPIGAWAQQGMPVIGLLNSGRPAPELPSLIEFRRGLAEAGYIEDQNLKIEYRWANNQSQAVQGLATDLVRRKVAVLVTLGPQLGVALAAKAATSTIPIVFAVGGDPVKYGLVASLNRPGGNMTGITFLSGELAGKRLNLLRELVPEATTIGFLSGGSRTLTFEEQTTDILSAGRALGRQIVMSECRSDRDFEMSFATFEERGAGALVVGAFPVFGGPRNREKIVALAAQHKLAAIYFSRQHVLDGGLMSYHADALGPYRQLGRRYVGQILKGAKPSELPVEQPTKFDFVINLKTAKALGVQIPPTLLVQADEVIE
jgi:putative ABC transport system substrate-binding protein